jgi:glycerophosphoryl diester phosphodiesterase
MNKSYSPIIVGHRGFFTVLENSLLAFKEAIIHKLPMIELDVWLTKDKIPVVIHTNSDTHCISETSTGKGLVKDFTLQEIKAFSLGKDEKIPTLEETFELCQGNLKINIEIKEKEDQVTIVKSILELAKKYNMEKDILISSFMHEYYEILRKFTDDIQFKFLVDEKKELDQVLTRPDELMKNTSICANSNALNKEYVEKLHQKGMVVSIYLYPDCSLRIDHINYLLDIRVDEFIVDDPVKAKEIIDSYLTKLI